MMTKLMMTKSPCPEKNGRNRLPGKPEACSGRAAGALRAVPVRGHGRYARRDMGPAVTSAARRHIERYRTSRIGWLRAALLYRRGMSRPLSTRPRTAIQRLWSDCRCVF